MSEPFIGQIIMFAGNFAPRGWALCQGQIMSIAQNTALFSILGTTYGGNGQTTFALPDLRGRVPARQGQGPGLPSMELGEVSGSPTHTLIITEMPAHNHLVSAPVSTADGNDTQPAGNLPAVPVVNVAGTDYQVSAYRSGTPADATFATGGSTTITGGSQPFSIMQPYLGMNFIIALEGIFPSRN